MDKRSLLLTGCVTDQGVAHAVKDAADLGYLVTLVTCGLFDWFKVIIAFFCKHLRHAWKRG
jgi:hypothetical protein